MGKQHFLQQAHALKKQNLIGRWGTEKLDGQRGFWDGGITTGMLKADVPWANIEGDERYKNVQYATGLWSRYGNVIHAPKWFTDKLPLCPLDGEVHAGRGKHQYTRSVVSQLIPDDRWHDITFGVFNSPNLQEVFHDRDINIKNGDKNLYVKQYRGILDWLNKHKANICHKERNMTYAETQRGLAMQNFWNDWCEYVVPTHMETQEQLDAFYLEILGFGGEGVVFSEGDAMYHCERVHAQVKQKPYLSEEAEVIGYVTGRVTDRGSKLLGLMGALVVRMPNGKEFELSGFTGTVESGAKERELTRFTSAEGDELAEAFAWAVAHPETRCPYGIRAVHFPIGSLVSYKYRELTDDGIPKEASYFRKREIE